MVMRLVDLSAFLLCVTAAAPATAQLDCGDRPETTVEYIGFRLEDVPPETQAELAGAVGALVSRFSLRCGWHLVLTVNRRSGGWDVRPNATDLDGGCEYELRIRDGSTRRGGRGSSLASAIEDVATNGGSRPSGRACTGP